MKSPCTHCKGKGYVWDVAQAVGQTILSLGVWTLIDALMPPDSFGAKQDCPVCDGSGVREGV